MAALHRDDGRPAEESDLAVSVRLLERQAARVLSSARADDVRTTVAQARALAARAVEFTSSVRTGGPATDHPEVALAVADTLLDALARAYAEVLELGEAAVTPGTAKALGDAGVDTPVA